MPKNRVGDLIYVPSEVILFKNDQAKQGTVEEWKKVREPANLLITAVRNRSYEVYYEGEYWLVNKKQVFFGRD